MWPLMTGPVKIINSRRKGAVGEREFANLLRGYGYVNAKRGQQFRGSPGSPDVVGVPGVHFEVKRTNRLKLYEALDQARKDSGLKSIPVVAHRCDGLKGRTSCRGDWLAILSFADLAKLLEKAGMGPQPISIEDFL